MLTCAPDDELRVSFLSYVTGKPHALGHCHQPELQVIGWGGAGEAHPTCRLFLI